MLDLIKRLTGFMCLTHQVNPNQKRSTDVITNNTRKTALAFFKTCQLFGDLTVKLFNLPANVAHLPHDANAGLTQVVGRNIIRAS